jgi:hypothetical protein
LTGLFESTWRPKKAVIILWRRVDTLSPDAYAELLEWVRAHSADDETVHWLEAMATNEVVVDAIGALAELDRVLRRRPPAEIEEHARLLRDLIWEACDLGSDWLTWRPCQVCGRRWATTTIEGVTVCPHHASPAVVVDFLQAEMTAYRGLVDHSDRLERLAALAVTPAVPILPVFAERARLNGVASEIAPAPDPAPMLELAEAPAAGADLEP